MGFELKIYLEDEMSISELIIELQGLQEKGKTQLLIDISEGNDGNCEDGGSEFKYYDVNLRGA